MQLKTFALSVAALSLGFSLTWAAAAPKKKAATPVNTKAQTAYKAPVKSTTAKSTTAKSTATKSVATKSVARPAAARRYTPQTRSRTTSTYARGRAYGRSPQPVPVRRYYGQQAPTTDRYLEIQQALVTRGFLQTPPSGAWDPASVDALKRFQEEQNLPPTGKITSLSLIALGLGPKRSPLTITTTQTQPVP